MKEQYLDTFYSPKWVLNGIKEHFTIQEFFSESMCKKYREDQLWSFLDVRLLSNLLFIRKVRGLPITINNWSTGGGFSQRGFRENTCNIVYEKTVAGKLYCSAHTRGAAVDFNESHASAENTRNWLEDQSEALPYPCRLEWKKNGEPISWVHLDVDYFENYPRVYKFNV